MIATFNGNLKTTIISCYSSTNVSYEMDVISYYQMLSSLVRSVPKHNLLLQCPKWKSIRTMKIHTYHEKTNRNGQYLVNYIEEHHLINVSINFMKCKNKQLVFTNPRGTKLRIDHILVNSKWKSSIINCEAYNSGFPIGSDHCITTCKIKFSLRANIHKSTKSPRYNYILITPLKTNL